MIDILTDDLNKVIRVLNLNITEMSNIFKVSRQSIYNWLSGDTPSVDNINRITDLSAAADLAVLSNIQLTGYILKRKSINGKSFIECLANNESAENTMVILLNILLKERDQRIKLEQKLIGRSPTEPPMWT